MAKIQKLIKFLSVTEMGRLKIGVSLDGEVKERFLAIKKSKGLSSNAEVLRLIICEYFEKNLAADNCVEVVT